MKTKDELLQELHEHCAFAEAWPDEHRKLERDVESNIRGAWLLGQLKFDFEEGDLLAAVSAMAHSYAWGFTVPLWANKHIAEAFDKYLDEGYFKGTAKLESFLGLSGKRPFARQQLRAQYEMICDEIGRLNRLLGFSLPITYRMINKCVASHLSISQIGDVYKDHGKHIRAFPLDNFSFKCDSFEELSERLLANDIEFKNELIKAGLLKSYLKTMGKIHKQFKPGIYSGGQSL